VERPRDGQVVGAQGARQENDIAARVQASILPGEVEIEGLGISAGMLPAEVVGGDYYDIIAVQDGCWIGIGDVAGHGLTAGVIMLMIQSAVQSLVRLSPQGNPRDLLCALNGALYENIRRRMKRDEHVTFCLARYAADGTLIFAGAHENILVCRADGGEFESIPADGAWLGAMKDVRHVTSQTTFQLRPGDLMVLFTDGVIEARNDAGQEFGFDRLRQQVMDSRDRLPREIRKIIMDAVLAWSPRPDDDVTLVVVRCGGVDGDR
jgi:sigma-B regulation protein RsbU (phosphoserine phosphatase)